MSADAPGWPADIAAAYRRTGYWRGETLGGVLRARADAHPQRMAVIGPDGRWSYGALDTEADRIAGGLHALGINAGDAVVVQLPNRGRFFAVCFALFRLGAHPVMALPAHRHAETSAFCAITGARAYVCADRHEGFDYRELAARVAAGAPALEHVIVDGEAGAYTALDAIATAPPPLPQPDPGDIALFQLSGGSTGVPKLIPRTHDDYLYSIRRSVEVCGVGEHSVYLAALPLGHNFPLSSPGSLGTLYAGGTVVVAPRPAPDEALALIERTRVTFTGLVPPLARLWLDAAGHAQRDLSSLRLLQVGGGRLDAPTAQRVRPALGCALQQVFGMAEGLVCYTRPDDPEEVVVHTQGRPMSEADEVRVVDDHDEDVLPGTIGHLLTRGPYTVRGYYRAPEHNARAFTADGFYRTGDLVRRRPDGNLVVEGRAKEQINRGGEKIATEEVEAHLRAHGQVHDAALVALPDAFLGERACAFVATGGAAPAARALADFLRERGLAGYKIPDRFEFVDALPRTALGKIDRRALRERLVGGSEPARTEPNADDRQEA